MTEKKCWNTIKNIRFAKKYPLPNYVSLSVMVTLTKHFLNRCREFGVFFIFWSGSFSFIAPFFFFRGWGSIIQCHLLKDAFHFIISWSLNVYFIIYGCSMREGKIRSPVAAKYLYLNGIYFNKIFLTLFEPNWMWLLALFCLPYLHLFFCFSILFEAVPS